MPACLSGAFEKDWNNHNVSIRVKGKIYRTIILSTLLGGAETWTEYRRHVRKLHAIMMRHLRSIMKVRWQDKVTNIKVLKRARLLSMENLLIRKNIRWIGHLLRMPTDRLSMQVLYSQLLQGQQSCGHLRLCYKDTIKRNLKKRDIDTNSWKSLALQRDVWRHSKLVIEMKAVCLPSEIYGRNGATPIFISFHRTTSSTTGGYSRWNILMCILYIILMKAVFVACDRQL